MDGRLLSIGDFSRMTFLTVKALRHYHDVGLLEPARTDPSSGYRYYRPEQVAEARLIRRLRDLDLPVDDVRTVLEAPDEATRNAVMVEHLDRMSRQLEQVQDTVDSLRRMLSGDDEEVGASYRDEPGRWCSRSAGMSRATGRLLVDRGVHRGASPAQDRGITRTGPDGAEFPTEFFTEGGAESVAFVPVDRAPPRPAGSRRSPGPRRGTPSPSTRGRWSTSTAPTPRSAAASSSERSPLRTARSSRGTFR